jgi:hypothetical protein
MILSIDVNDASICFHHRDRDAGPSRPLRYWDLDPEQVRHVLHKRNKGSSSKSRPDSSDRKRSRKS